MRAASDDRLTTYRQTQDKGNAGDQEQLDLLAYQRQMSESVRGAGEGGSRRSDPDGFALVLAAMAAIAEEGWIFTSDDVRARVGPGYEGVMGAAFATARREGWLEAVGFGISKAVTRHGGLLRQWRRVAP